MKKIKCQGICFIPGEAGGTMWDCPHNAKYKVINHSIIRNGKKVIKFVCGKHIKKYFYNYKKKLRFPDSVYTITLIKETGK